MIQESTVLVIVMILLGIIDLLLFFVYALFRERVLRRWGEIDGQNSRAERCLDGTNEENRNGRDELTGYDR